jgi:amino acid transporter
MPRLNLLRLATVLFFIVSGGPYGLEDLVGSTGPGMALALIVLAPLVWALPAALVVAELSAAIPEQGGYYVWVRRALGPFWAFQEGWWSWIYSFVDMAIYPVLFAEYLSSLLVEQFGVTLLAESRAAHWATTLAFVWALVGVNLRGARAAGSASTVFAVVVLAPFVVLWGLGAAKLAREPVAFWEPWIAPTSELWGAFSVGLYVVMWNYLGWDGLSTFAAETEDPRRNAPRALAIVLPLVTLVYLATAVAGLVGDVPWSEWEAGAWPRIAASLGGGWLGTCVAAGGMVAAAGFFNSLLLSNSRLPFVMAADGRLPPAIARVDPRTGVPRNSLLLCGVVYSTFTLLEFKELVVLDVLLYSGALILEFVALVALRIREPKLERPFRIPGGWSVLAVVCTAPLAVLVLAVVSAARDEGVGMLGLSMTALATGPVAYAVTLRTRGDHAAR